MSNLRPAEEVAREMVTAGLAGLEIVIEDSQEAAIVYARENHFHGTIGKLQRTIARLVEKSRAEGAAAAQPEQPRDLAGRIRALIQDWAGRCAGLRPDDHAGHMAFDCATRIAHRALYVARGDDTSDSERGIDGLIRSARKWAASWGDARSAREIPLYDELEAIVRNAVERR